MGDDDRLVPVRRVLRAFQGRAPEMYDVALAQVLSHPFGHLTADIGKVVVRQPTVKDPGRVEHLSVADQVKHSPLWRHRLRPRLRRWPRPAARRRSGSWHYHRARRTKTKPRTRWAVDTRRHPAWSGRTRRNVRPTGSPRWRNP